MATIGVGEFKTKCLRLLDEVAQRQEELIITRRGRPIARLVLARPDQALFGPWRGPCLARVISSRQSAISGRRRRE